MDENNKQNKPTGEKKGGKRGFSPPSDNSEPTNATGKTAQKEIKDNRLWGVVM